jgi:hypothetical protein
MEDQFKTNSIIEDPPVSGKMSCELIPDLGGEILSRYAF